MLQTYWRGAHLHLLFSYSELGPGPDSSDWTAFMLRQELRTAAQQDKKLRKRRANLVKAVQQSPRHVAGNHSAYCFSLWNLDVVGFAAGTSTTFAIELCVTSQVML